MGFSTAQLDILEPLVADMRDRGYEYYLCHQNIMSNTSNDFDLIIYFSKDEIFGTGLYTYTVPSGSVCYYIRSGNASSYNNTGIRFSVDENVDLILNYEVENYNHISTNATFMSQAAIQPDLCLEVQQYETQGGILFTLCVFLLLFSFFKLFRR